MADDTNSEQHKQKVFWGPVTVDEIKQLLSFKKPPEKIGKRASICVDEPSRTIYSDSPTTDYLLKKKFFGNAEDDLSVSFTSEYFTPNETLRTEKSGTSSHAYSTPNKSCINTEISSDDFIEKVSKALNLSNCSSNNYEQAVECLDLQCHNEAKKSIVYNNSNNKNIHSSQTDVIVLSDDDDGCEKQDVFKLLENSVIYISSDDDSFYEIQDVKDKIKECSSNVLQPEEEFTVNTSNDLNKLKECTVIAKNKRSNSNIPRWSRTSLYGKSFGSITNVIGYSSEESTGNRLDNNSMCLPNNSFYNELASDESPSLDSSKKKLSNICGKNYNSSQLPETPLSNKLNTFNKSIEVDCKNKEEDMACSFGEQSNYNTSLHNKSLGSNLSVNVNSPKPEQLLHVLEKVHNDCNWNSFTTDSNKEAVSIEEQLHNWHLPKTPLHNKSADIKTTEGGIVITMESQSNDHNLHSPKNSLNNGSFESHTSFTNFTENASDRSKILLHNESIKSNCNDNEVIVILTKSEHLHNKSSEFNKTSKTEEGKIVAENQLNFNNLYLPKFSLHNGSFTCNRSLTADLNKKAKSVVPINDQLNHHDLVKSNTSNKNTDDQVFAEQSNPNSLRGELVESKINSGADSNMVEEAGMALTTDEQSEGNSFYLSKNLLHNESFKHNRSFTTNSNKKAKSILVTTTKQPNNSLQNYYESPNGQLFHKNNLQGTFPTAPQGEKRNFDQNNDDVFIDTSSDNLNASETDTSNVEYHTYGVSHEASSFSECEFNDTFEELQMALEDNLNCTTVDSTSDEDRVDYNISETSDKMVNSLSFKSETTKIPKRIKPLQPQINLQKSTPIKLHTDFKIPKLATVGPSKTPDLKNIVSPVAVYIKNSPRVPQRQNVQPKTLFKQPLCFKNAVIKNSSNKENNEPDLPSRVYKPAKCVIASKEKEVKLPPSIQKHVPHIPDVIKHTGRIGGKASNTDLIEAKLLTNDLTICYNDTSVLNSSESVCEVSLLTTKKTYIN